ncbi:MAG TPA: hypothetical protein VMH80_18330 [Bryobacteraceae bacterium]|nr:hypothetical protein [Bryobacteraceae bacterium]
MTARILCVAILALSPCMVFADSFSIQTIDIPGATGFTPYAINDSGEIVGAYGDASGFHTFLYSNGTFTNH